MNQVTMTAPTAKLALESALKQLNTTEEQVDVNVIDAGKKGFLGIGSRPAVVKVTLKNKSALDILTSVVEEAKTTSSPVMIKSKTEKQEPMANDKQSDQESQLEAIKHVESFILQVAGNMGVEVQIAIETEGKYCRVSLTGEKIAMLIGKRGQVLNSLQYLAQLVANRFSNQYMTVLLDAENYRVRRKETLEHLAHKMADKAIYTRREVALEPMPSYERKIIHAVLMNKRKVKTYSTGTDPYRHIVIVPN